MRQAERQSIDLPEEDMVRANWYALLSRLFADSPDEETIAIIRSLKGDESPWGQAIDRLVKEANAQDPESIEEEYNALFVGVTRGELVPYASYYLTGFLNERPTLKMVEDMARLGVSRADDRKEPEDGIATMLEVMRGLILGEFGEPADQKQQKEFFQAHLAPWADTFFEDLENAEAARFYRPVGEIGRLFMGIEDEAFKMTA